MENTAVGRERAQEFGIVRWASAAASIIVDAATDGGAPLNDADESPTIARDGNGDGIGNGGAGADALAQGGGALGWQQNAGPITQQNNSIETTSKDEDDGER